MSESSNISWNILDIFFRDNPNFLVNHHLQSYNDFFDNGINQLIKEKNPIHFFKNQERMTIDYETRFIDANGNKLTDESDYTTRLGNGESVYISCFVGCTYHCG